MAEIIRIYIEAEGSIGTVLFCHNRGTPFHPPSAFTMLRIAKPPAMERFPVPLPKIADKLYFPDVCHSPAFDKGGWVMLYCLRTMLYVVRKL